MVQRVALVLVIACSGCVTRPGDDNSALTRCVAGKLANSLCENNAQCAVLAPHMPLVTAVRRPSSDQVWFRAHDMAPRHPHEYVVVLRREPGRVSFNVTGRDVTGIRSNSGGRSVPRKGACSVIGTTALLFSQK